MIVRHCPFEPDEFCKYEKNLGEPRYDKCEGCKRNSKKLRPVKPQLDDYTKKLIRENNNFLNIKNVYKLVLTKHKLLKEANALLHDLMPDCYDVNGDLIE